MSLSYLKWKDPSLTASSQVEMKPLSVNSRSITGQKSQFNKRVKKGIRKPPTFFTFINPFFEISSSETTKAVLLRKSLDGILRRPILRENHQEPSSATPLLNQKPLLVKHSNDDFGLIDPSRKPSPYSQKIETPCCSMNNSMVIHCFTDGGCIYQGQLNAAAAFGFAFPRFPSYDQTEVVPKWRVSTSSRAEMEAYIGCMEASICIIASHGLTSNCLIDICSDSLTWPHPHGHFLDTRLEGQGLEDGEKQKLQ